jgi:hypothetical protein
MTSPPPPRETIDELRERLDREAAERVRVGRPSEVRAIPWWESNPLGDFGT